MSDKIHEAMTAILADVGAIGKDSRNQQQGFNFRGIDDAYNSLHGLMAKHKVYTVPRVTNMERMERTTKNGGTLLYSLLTVEYDFICDDGSRVTVGPVIGEGMDSGDKASNKALAVAHKYALFQTFMIPTMMVDPDYETHQVEKQDSPLATDEQKALIEDFKESGAISPRRASWIGNNLDTMTAKNAETILNEARESECVKKESS